MERKHIVKSYDKKLNGLKTRVAELGAAARSQIADAVKAITTSDVVMAAQVIQNDKEVNRQQIDTEELAVHLLATRQPVAVDLREIISALKISSELERIADYAANIVKNIDDSKLNSDKPLLKSITKMAEVGQAMLVDIISAYLEVNDEKAISVWHRDDEIDEIYVDVLSTIRNRVQNDSNKANDYTSLIFAARCCERIGDHITNVAENIYYIKHGELYINGKMSTQ
jgi:phosphate transport system protein